MSREPFAGEDAPVSGWRGWLPILIGVLLVFRLVAALAPGQPLVFGVPAGLALELAVVAASTGVLWVAVRTLLPRRTPPESDRGRRAPAPDHRSPGGRG